MKSVGHLVLLLLFAVFAALAFMPARARAAMAPRPLRPSPRPMIDVEAMLYALRTVETGGAASAIGPKGERSAYQFTRSTWSIYTSTPFEQASTDRDLADLVARAHLGYIRGHLARRCLPQQPAYVAAAWHSGPWFRHADARSDYARRVATVYAEAVRS